MIKIQFTGHPPSTYQIDRSYNLPSISGQVRWNGINKCFEVCDNSTGINGGWLRIDNTVEMTSQIDIHEMHRWIEEKKREEQELKELRNKYPALDEAYRHMEFVKELVKSRTDSEKEIAIL